MRAGQWVAFDASTEKPHKCGKKNKEDPNIKELAKQKNKIQKTENVDLGYESEIDLEIETLEAQLEDIKKKKYKYGNKCFNYELESSTCDNNKKIINFA